jgi:hypothetical protein
MKTYHFDIADGVRLEDPVGMDCVSDGDAKAKADAIARQIAEDMGDRERRAVIVVDDSGEELYRVPIKTAQHRTADAVTDVTARTTAAKD